MLGVIRPSSLSLGLLEIQAAGHHINITRQTSLRICKMMKAIGIDLEAPQMNPNCDGNMTLEALMARRNM